MQIDMINDQLIRARVKVLAELLDLDGMPADIITGVAMVNIGVDMLYVNGVPPQVIINQLHACIDNILAGQLSTRKG